MCGRRFAKNASYFQKNGKVIVCFIFLLKSQGSMSGGRRKKASTSSVVSSASIDFSPFINLMG